MLLVWLQRRVWFVCLVVSCLAYACGTPTTVPAGNGAPPRTAPLNSATGRATRPPLPSDLSLLTLVTKQRGLPASYRPADLVQVPPEYTSSAEPQWLRQAALQALIQMLTAASGDGLGIKVLSGYRSYDYQAEVFRSEVALDGCAKALRESALAGHSEHQLGLAADLTSADVGWDLKESFAQTPEGRWLAAHAASYGFVLSYPEGKEEITGYEYEPWHYRFVTEPVAEAIVASGETATQYLTALGNITRGPTIPATSDSGAANKSC
jgi:zinc D-Ala-D-Ala carboxypeptidase